MNDGDFKRLIALCSELSELFSDGLIFIGGIAVYLHSINHKETNKYAEFTHDADFYISMADMADLRDIEEVVANRRLSKHQLIKDGFEFDIYTERHSKLIVPYDQIAAHASTYSPLRVASIEHLVVLKLEAYRDRRASSKGQKDARDLIIIGILAALTKAQLNLKLMEPYLSDEHLKLISEIAAGPAFLSLAKGNSKEAKELRQLFQRSLAAFLK